LAKTGVQYTQAYVNRLDGTATNPSDSFPGLLALVTGGSSPTHGGWYDVAYARDLYTDSTCATQGAAATYDETIETDNTGLWGNGTTSGPTHDVNAARTNISTAAIPWRKTLGSRSTAASMIGTCTPVLAHNFIRVNTIFEVVHDAGLHTAWSDKHLSYEMVSGPSGNGVDDFFAPEINSLATNLPGTAAISPAPAAGDDFTRLAKYTEVYDDYKVQAIINQIDGKWSDDGLAGATDVTGTPGVPAIFGMNFQAVSVAQKDARTGEGGGYADAMGTPNAGLADALAHTDASIGKMVAELTAKGTLSSTLIVITAKHGQSPIDNTLVVRKDPDVMAGLINAAAPVAGHIEDDVGLYWLNDPTTAAAGVAAFTAAVGTSNDPSFDTVYSSASPMFTAMFGDPTRDAHTPDIIVKVKHGTIYSTSTKKWAEHGGFADDDSNVGLLVSHPALSAKTVSTAVRTKQVAPTILESLCLDPTGLTAVQKEGTQSLPGLSFTCAASYSPMRWTADNAPTQVTISGGPWTTKQLAASGETDTLGVTLTHKNYGYCNPFGASGVRQGNTGVATMSPYYFPMVVGTGMTLQGFFDWRDKDTNEGIVAASSTDGGKTWTFQQDALYLTEACPADDTQTNPNATAVDDGYGHPYVVETAGATRLYTLDRSANNIDNLGLIVIPLTATMAQLQTGTQTMPLAPAPKDGPVAGAGLTRTTGLLNPDGILGVVPGMTPTTVLYVEKQLGAATSLPANQQCGNQPYAPWGASKAKTPNTDLVTIRLAQTTDGVAFTDMGPVNGLNDPTTTSYLGTRWVAPSGTIIKVDATHYGLFFSGGNCMDADSDSFHYVGYAESTDLVNWKVINGLQNPIISLLTEVLTVGGAQTTIPAQMPVVGPAQGWFLSRVYSPTIAKLDATHVTMLFAGYGVQTPNNDLRNYRNVGTVVLSASRALP
jgi:hypothetical protein